MSFYIKPNKFVNIMKSFNSKPCLAEGAASKDIFNFKAGDAIEVYEHENNKELVCIMGQNQTSKTLSFKDLEQLIVGGTFCMVVQAE